VRLHLGEVGCTRQLTSRPTILRDERAAGSRTLAAGGDPPGAFVSRGPERSGLFSFRTEREAITDKKLRVNDEIRISPIRLIDDAGEQVGIVSLEEARERARESGLDLVEVAPGARPPVVRLLDHGKWRYEQAKAAQEARRHQHRMQIKEVKFRPGIGEHDYEFKARHARRFLESGNKLKLTMQFRGRQMSHPEIGREILERLVAGLGDVGVPESEPTLEGRFMTMMVAPRKAVAKKSREETKTREKTKIREKTKFRKKTQ